MWTNRPLNCHLPATARSGAYILRGLAHTPGQPNGLLHAIQFARILPSRSKMVTAPSGPRSPNLHWACSTADMPTSSASAIRSSLQPLSALSNIWIRDIPNLQFRRLAGSFQFPSILWWLNLPHFSCSPYYLLLIWR